MHEILELPQVEEGPDVAWMVSRYHGRKNMGDDDPCQSRISSVLVYFATRIGYASF